MEPAFQRGDLLFLWNRNLGMNQYAGPPAHEHSPGTQVGEIVVYNVVGKDIPIVHRVVRRHKGEYVSPTVPHHPPPRCISGMWKLMDGCTIGLRP